MEEKTFEERKDKILNKIFVNSDEIIKKLQTENKILLQENTFLASKKKERAWQIIKEVGIIMRRHESEFEEKTGKVPSEETKDCFTGFWEKLNKELPQILNPDLRKIIILKREYQDKVKKQEESLKNLKKEGKIEIKKMRLEIKKTI